MLARVWPLNVQTIRILEDRVVTIARGVPENLVALFDLLAAQLNVVVRRAPHRPRGFANESLPLPFADELWIAANLAN